MAIRFFEEEIKFKLPNRNKYKRWLKSLAFEEGFSIEDLNYIFCTDEYLHKINLEYLQHDTYTDIITFDQSEFPKRISGEIYISIDRVVENAKSLQVTFEKEINRVISHGLLHLCGYTDKNKSDELNMRIKEEAALGVFENIK
ncbi:rRNA maturation RNase YbeY [Lunatibacter salilacus]|uniref:rRNA maturation RNase YbeY n=1 Tax=Lunatibacter salilacus TaxID=2483804 RepID=UPI00131A6818|nr:rRNA maturation RNase YbeY [Lunatibacter salilacus]